MSLEVFQRPQSQTAPAGVNWNAVRNPVIYKFGRRDFEASQINNDGGNVQVQSIGFDISADITVGDIIMLHTFDNVFSIFAEVLSVLFSAGDTFVTLDYPYS